MTQIITGFKGTATIMPESRTTCSGPKVRLSVNSKGPAPKRSTEDSSGKIVTWNGKSYRITVFKQGKVCNPTNAADWDTLKNEYLDMLNALDEALKKTDKVKNSILKDSSTFSYNVTNDTFTATKSGKPPRTIDLKTDFKTFTKEEGDIHACMGKVSNVITRFTHTEAPKPSEKIPRSSDSRSSDEGSDIGSVGSTSPKTSKAYRKSKKKNGRHNDDTTRKARVRKHNGDVSEITIKRLSDPKKQIRTDDVVAFLSLIQKDKPLGTKKFDFAHTYIDAHRTQTNPTSIYDHYIAPAFQAATDPNNLIYAIPVHTPGHFTLILVDGAKKELCFYDSLGRDPWEIDPLLNKQFTNLRYQLPLMDALLTSTEPWTVVSTDSEKAPHQHDGVTCGPFILNCICEILKGTSFEQFINTPMSEDEVVKMRGELTQYFLDMSTKEESETHTDNDQRTSPRVKELSGTDSDTNSDDPGYKTAEES